MSSHSTCDTGSPPSPFLSSKWNLVSLKVNHVHCVIPAGGRRRWKDSRVARLKPAPCFFFLFVFRRFFISYERISYLDWTKRFHSLYLDTFFFHSSHSLNLSFLSPILGLARAIPAMAGVGVHQISFSFSFTTFIFACKCNLLFSELLHEFENECT